MKNIAIIPARSGSKGLVNKNIKSLCGKPLIAHSIEAAIDSGMFDEIMVSTDSQQYAGIAKEYGASVPFLRSAATSTDTASSWAVIDEVLQAYTETAGRSFDTFCLLQPTSPLRTAKDIVDAYQLFEDKASFAVVSVCEVEHSPLWCGHLPPNHEFVGFLDQESIRQRQANGIFYRLNGAIYIANIQRYHKDKFLYQQGSYAYIMSQARSIDIDTELDFKIAEVLMKESKLFQ